MAKSVFEWQRVVLSGKEWQLAKSGFKWRKVVLSGKEWIRSGKECVPVQRMVWIGNEKFGMMTENDDEW